jgi:nucleic acid/nucleotide deaminase of polymorphic system toxin
VTPGHRQKTEGAWQDDDGAIHKLISGRHEEDFEAALAHAKKLGLIPERGTLGTAADVELKFAMKMRRDGMMKAVIALNKRPCPGRLGCDELLKRFLPLGAELVVHGPDNFEKTYRGEPEIQ